MMARHACSLIFSLFVSLLATGVDAKVRHLLPIPQKISPMKGKPFALGRPVALGDPTGCAWLRQVLSEHGCTLSRAARAKVRVRLVDSIPGAFNHRVAGFADEAYRLTVSEDDVLIEALNATGVLRAAQTLGQLAEGYAPGERAAIEPASITDWPAFKVRGFMHDVGRSYLSVDELKREIDRLARFKVNVFHWHLTEGLAWRFEVKAYPQLTAASHMVRYAGSYYTQDQCRELVDYAAARGVAVVPEIDMPGHSAAFTRAMGFDMQTDAGVRVLKGVLDEVCNVFARSPYIHIGGDEVIVSYPHFLETMSAYLRAKGFRVLMWNRLMSGAPSADICDMTQMWATSGRAVAGLPNIDCRYNYTNHFDVYADLVGIYQSSIYYTQQGTDEVAGTVSCAWNDTKTPAESDIVRQNNIYPNVIASAVRAWQGGGKHYIEQGGTTLPVEGEEYEAFADFERRLLFHKNHCLKDAPIAYVRQSNVYWRVSEPFPNGGDRNMRFPPETLSADPLPAVFVYSGRSYSSRLAAGAGIYLRHIWHPVVPSFLENPTDSLTVYAWTYVYSPKVQTAGAQVEFYTYSRSGNEVAPPAGEWDRRGSKLWINGEEIPAPKWEQPDALIPQDDALRGLKNENLTARPVVEVRLKAGWNKILMRLPHVDNGGTGRDKWQFTFVLTDREGRDALEGILYAPDRVGTSALP